MTTLTTISTWDIVITLLKFIPFVYIDVVLTTMEEEEDVSSGSEVLDEAADGNEVANDSPAE